MSELKDRYESMYETQDADTKQKLSQLQETIKTHIETAPLQMLENSVMGKDVKKQLSITELLSAGYGNRISRDVIMRYLTGSKNEKATFFGKAWQMLGDKFVDQITKQNNSYDSVLIAHEKIIIQKFQTELTALKSAIALPSQGDTSDKPSSSPVQSTEQNNEGYAKESHYTEDEKIQINEVIASAKKFEGTKYAYGGTSKSGIDCSGIWSMAFKEQYKDEGQNFGRLTAALFDATAPDIPSKDVEKGDWMFWEDPQGIKKGGKNEKGEKIYHIEMALGKPFEKDGKWYVKTYGSSSDENMTDANGARLNNGRDGVGYRIREIKDNHHFAKPPYYAKLVAMNDNKDNQRNAA